MYNIYNKYDSENRVGVDTLYNIFPCRQEYISNGSHTARQLHAIVYFELGSILLYHTICIHILNKKCIRDLQTSKKKYI